MRFNSFLRYFGLLGCVTYLLLFCWFVFASFSNKTLINRKVTVRPQESKIIEKISLNPQSSGALRVDVKALMPTNHWVAYEIKMLDEQGNILVSAIKEAWKESGTWREEGESGTWSEEDLKGGIDIRSKEEQQVTLALNVLGYGRNTTDIDSSISFDVRVENRLIDSRYFWLILVFYVVFLSLLLIRLDNSADAYKTGALISNNFYIWLATGIIALMLYHSYQYKSAFILGQKEQNNYSPRHGTELSGQYYGGVWHYNSTTRSSFGSFQGGGPGAGK